MPKYFLSHLHEEYIKDTEPKAIVEEKRILLCNLTIAVARGVNFPAKAVYVNTIALKHLYDTKPAQVYDFIIANLHKIVKFPDQVYKNNPSKRGSLFLVKTINNKKYFCSIEINKEDNEINIVTAFDVKDKYLEKFELLWSWRDGTPSS